MLLDWKPLMVFIFYLFIFVFCQISQMLENQLMQEIHADQTNGSKLNFKKKRISQTTLECVKQPANSQRRWERERRCSRRTWGQPSASLLSCKSPNSPRRCSSEGGKKQIRRRRGWEDEALKISMTMLDIWSLFLQKTAFPNNDEQILNQLKLAHSAQMFPLGVSMTTEKEVKLQWLNIIRVGKPWEFVSKTCHVFLRKKGFLWPQVNEADLRAGFWLNPRRRPAAQTTARR